jgi:hypothetical protein
VGSLPKSNGSLNKLTGEVEKNEKSKKVDIDRQLFCMGRDGNAFPN